MTLRIISHNSSSYEHLLKTVTRHLINGEPSKSRWETKPRADEYQIKKSDLAGICVLIGIPSIKLDICVLIFSSLIVEIVCVFLTELGDNLHADLMAVAAEAK